MEHKNGKFQKVKRYFYSSNYDSNNPDANKINTTPVEKDFSYSDVSDDSAKTVYFNKPVDNVQAVKVEVEASVNTSGQYNASAAEISFFLCAGYFHYCYSETDDFFRICGTYR